MTRYLVEGRECGTCVECCVSLTIDDPQLQKPSGERCRNLADAGCAIYEDRPSSCRSFHCGWRRFRWVPESLRPDRSRILIKLQVDGSGGGETSILFFLLDVKGLLAPGLAEALAAAIRADVPVSLVVQEPPGKSVLRCPLNELLNEPVRRRDKAGILRILREIREQGIRNGVGWVAPQAGSSSLSQ